MMSLLEVSGVVGKKLSRTGLVSCRKLGISTASVAEVRMRLEMDGKELTMKATSSWKPSSRDLSNSSRQRVVIEGRVMLPRRIWSARRPGVPTRRAGGWMRLFSSVSRLWPP